MKWLIKILFRFYPADFAKMVYGSREPKKHLPTDKLTFTFLDLYGRAYYHVNEDAKTPILRQIKNAILYTNLASGISDEDIMKSLEAINAALNERNKKDKMQPNIARIGFICVQLLNRRGRIIVADHLYNLAANYFIREDEDYEFVDEVILSDKIESLKALPMEVIKSFFFEKSLNELFPFAHDPNAFFDEILKEGNIEAMAYLKTIDNGRHG